MLVNMLSIVSLAGEWYSKSSYSPSWNKVHCRNFSAFSVPRWGTKLLSVKFAHRTCKLRWFRLKYNQLGCGADWFLHNTRVSSQSSLIPRQGIDKPRSGIPLSSKAGTAQPSTFQRYNLGNFFFKENSDSEWRHLVRNRRHLWNGRD